MKGRKGQLTTLTISLQDLRREIYRKAKSEKHWRFWGMYNHICRMDTLMEAYRMAKANKGASGVDGQTFEMIEEAGVSEFLQGIRQELLQRTYQPQRNRQVLIPKGESKKMRELGIPTIKDRVVQGAVRLILEPIFEADFCNNTYGYRPKRSCAGAMYRVSGAVMQSKLTQVIDVDLSNYFDNIRHHTLLKQVAQRVNDGKVMTLLKRILRAQGKKGVPQGGSLSPLLANLYMANVDKVFENAEKKTRVGDRSYILYTRFSDDIVIAVGKHPRWSNLKEHALRRLREELHKLGVKINEEKTKVVDLKQGESFAYLGFECRYIKSRQGKWFLFSAPKMRKRKELVAKIRETIRESGRRTVKELVEKINPILSGWVNYFRTGNSNRTFGYVKTYVESRVRRFAMRQRLRKGMGWKRWSIQMIYGEWGLFNDYTIRYYRPSEESSFLPLGI
jgi:RNA-directed DNA polymerase